MKKFLLFLLVLAVVLALSIRLRYGGGEAYADLSGPPVLAESALQEVLSYAEPIGSVAISESGRVFFTVHPDSRPQGNRLLQYVDGASVPFPNVQSQQRLFDTVLGITVDRQNRLWTIDHGNHGTRTARLLAFDLDSGDLVHDQKFEEAIAPVGSLLQNIEVSIDGRTVVIADASLWRKQPALIVYDIGTASARRVLDSHSSVSAEDYVIRNHGRAMTFGGGLVAFRSGVDGMALGDEWLYFGANCGSGLYRILLSDLTDTGLSDDELAARIERYADKPMSAGLDIDSQGNVYVTDVEHGAVMRVGQNRQLDTLVVTTKLRWAQALSFGPDRWLYVADSALGDVVLKSREHIRTQGPYQIFRFRSETAATPGPSVNGQ